MKVTAVSPRELAPARTLLVRYRRLTPPWRHVDQRLAIFEDGLVELDERHRTRDSTWLTIDSRDLDRLRAALEQIPKRRWSLGPSLTLSRASVALDFAFSFEEDLGHSFFQMRRGRRTISGVAGFETDIAAVALLDDLRVSAVRLAEELKPTR